MNAEQITKLAMARTSEITDQYPTNRSLCYRRIGLRQRELMALAARENPDYYGTCATAPLSAGGVDLNMMEFPVATPELVEEVRIENPGTSTYAAGDKINIVKLQDREAALAPRMTLRDLVLQAVGTDLDNVTSITVFYSRLPEIFDASDGESFVELQDPYIELLVIDLTKMLLTKATRLPADIRSSSLTLFAAEEASLLTQYLDHVRTYGPYTTRFGTARQTSAKPVEE